ncbi:hypothetical protein HYPDE_26408 [Hyphomicrobium denitrificans 1NES1]|uniref:Uncharacterized protein n=1 Tax=Hyphomicrobium denitrificans 1NES1 TaxID=670307 RepID=N0B448_9HYPH|nr:hypothetical protein HYPDE_26408 [Hyphomicrobium denitrificans 1NES1]
MERAAQTSTLTRPFHQKSSQFFAAEIGISHKCRDLFARHLKRLRVFRSALQLFRRDTACRAGEKRVHVR